MKLYMLLIKKLLIIIECQEILIITIVTPNGKSTNNENLANSKYANCRHLTESAYRTHSGTHWFLFL